ncbi:MAG: hypothetical protein U0531_11115 [Dehalococcoidia bacterium]
MISSRSSPSALMTNRALTAGISSWTRISDNVLPPRVKALPNYATLGWPRPRRVVTATRSLDLLNPGGKVSEGPGVVPRSWCVTAFITPPSTAGTLESITRDACTRLLLDMGVPVETCEMERTGL